MRRSVPAIFLSALSLGVKVTGAGTLELCGEVSELEIDCTGARTIRADDLAARDARVRLTGSGNVRVRVEKSLNASVSGAGKILYLGDPNVERTLSGAGSVRKAGD